MTSWIARSLIAMAVIVPSTLITAVVCRNFKLSIWAILIWYFGGTFLTAACCCGALKMNLKEFAPSYPLIMMAFSGALIVAFNVFIMRAMACAPNPALPSVITTGSAVCVYFIAAIFAGLIPKYFSNVRFDWIHVLGIALTISGVAIITLRR